MKTLAFRRGELRTAVNAILEIVDNTIVAILSGIGLALSDELRISVLMLSSGSKQHYPLEIKRAFVPAFMNFGQARHDRRGYIPLVNGTRWQIGLMQRLFFP